MKAVKGCSLWLMPEGHVYETLSALIRTLSARYKSPVFEPHVTLLGQVLSGRDEVVSGTVELCRCLSPFRISLTGTGHSAEFFRCVFARAAGTAELKAANLRARRIFRMEGGRAFTPHLSLLYGNLPGRERAALAREARGSVCATFPVRTVWVVSTEGGPERWFKVREVVMASGLVPR